VGCSTSQEKTSIYIYILKIIVFWDISQCSVVERYVSGEVLPSSSGRIGEDVEVACSFGTLITI
jgi:hypothetical protein